MLIFKSKQKKFEGDLKIKLSGKRLYPVISRRQKMVTRKMFNRFHVGKNGIRVGNFQIIVFFQIFNQKLLKTDFFHSKTCLTTQMILNKVMITGNSSIT